MAARASIIAAALIATSLAVTAPSDDQDREAFLSLLTLRVKLE
jgi:hypothetical protein